MVYSALRDLRLIRWLFLVWAGFASITAIRSFVQFGEKVEKARELHVPFYNFYIGERITGFMSHWNTFSAQEMFALIMLGAFLLFGPVSRDSPAGACQEQSRLDLDRLRRAHGAGRAAGRDPVVWIATAVAAFYLALVLETLGGRWRCPWLAAVAFLLRPARLARARFTSYHPIRPARIPTSFA